MSKKTTGSFSKLNSSSSCVPKLQTNVGQLDKRNSLISLPDAAEDNRSRQKYAVRKSKLVKNNFVVNENLKVHTDSSENDAFNGRPEVLSIDSDFSSGNDVIDSSDQDALKDESNSSKTLKQRNIVSDARYLQELKLSCRESLKPLSADYSYCTPPKLSEEKGPQRKKDEQCGLFSQNTALHSETAPVSSAQRQRVLTVHGSATNNVEQISSNRDRQTNVKVKSLCGSDENFQQAGEEVMDMKYADLTHMQLKRSLDQIHGQNIRAGGISRSLPEPFFSSAQGSTNAFYSHAMNENVQLPQSVGPRIVGNPSQVAPDPLFNNYSEGAYNNVGLAVPQPSKFDTIFQVKDAMLQEKEAVILKLRLQVSSLQHQVQEGEAALRQVSCCNLKKMYAWEISMIGLPELILFFLIAVGANHPILKIWQWLSKLNVQIQVQVAKRV